ncbi:3-dehydroquinate dehydratase [bacterium SCSIO 12741]|nr:3-dehydroquinate dehydratase [bacterium SCSIO 12741]
MKLLILNGPNLNLLGKREPDIYGTETAEGIFEKLQNDFPNCQLSYYQSNVEGELINRLHEADGQVDGVVFNAGGYTHTSVAIADAIAAISVPVVEVHLSNILGRNNPEREVSLMARNCVGVISGFGWKSYALAIRYFES